MSDFQKAREAIGWVEELHGGGRFDGALLTEEMSKKEIRACREHAKNAINYAEEMTASNMDTAPLGDFIFALNKLENPYWECVAIYRENVKSSYKCWVPIPKIKESD